MARRRDEIPPGNPEMFILNTLARGGQMHGFAIADFIQEDSEYPALKRLLLKSWIEGERGNAEMNRRAILPADSRGSPPA